MKISIYAMIAATLFAAQILFAQETAPPDSVPEAVAAPETAAEETAAPAAEPAPAPLPALVAALPKPSVAQALGGTNLPKVCVEEFTSLMEKDGFSMGKFMKDLLPAVAKTKLQLKSPFGKPNDGDKISVGLTVGCVKALPESPAEITSLLKDVSLKVGLDLIVEAVEMLSVAQALGSTNLPKVCVEEFASLMEKDGFSMGKFMKDLPPAVAKTKLQLKSPFGKPKDGDKTSVGLSVGCIKALPESPAEVTSLLKDVSLKAGLDLAVEAAENFVENSIPTNIPKESSSGGGLLKPITSIGLITGGLGAIIYGVTQNGEVSRYVDKGNGKAAVDAESSRNMSYGIGTALLAGGLIISLVF